MRPCYELSEPDRADKRLVHPDSTDFAISELGLSVLLPISLERREIGSDFETGFNVPTVNYEVLDTSTVGGVSFYGDPMRIVFETTRYRHEHRISAGL
jgi:hypothetical protein